MALGSGATVTRANQIVVGTASNSYTLPGLASGGSFVGTTNQSGEIQFVTVDSTGNLGTNNFSPTAINNSISSINDNISTLNSSLTATNSRLSSAEKRITNVENRLDTAESSLKTMNSQIENVGALAAALSSIPNLTSDNKTYGCGIGTGGYGSGWAGAAGCTGKVGSNVWLNGAIAFTGANSTPWGSTSSVAGRVGVFLQWGGPKQ
ncbi:MAG: hypothetical protein RLZZ54_2841 [Cyanobacteriota bacterium]|jgi:hypothetical protein